MGVFIQRTSNNVQGFFFYKQVNVADCCKLYEGQRPLSVTMKPLKDAQYEALAPPPAQHSVHHVWSNTDNFNIYSFAHQFVQLQHSFFLGLQLSVVSITDSSGEYFHIQLIVLSKNVYHNHPNCFLGPKNCPTFLVQYQNRPGKFGKKSDSKLSHLRNELVKFANTIH